MRLGKETGSVVNWTMSRCATLTPEVGMGATILFWSDRKAGTIIEVSDKHFVMQADICTRTDKNGISESQEYRYAPNPKGQRYEFRKVRSGKLKGKWRENGTAAGAAVLIGERDHYFDYSF